MDPHISSMGMLKGRGCWSSGAASHSEHRDRDWVWVLGWHECWFRVWEPRARGPGPSPRRLSLIVCMWEGVHGHIVCVREPRQDLTLRALAQLNKLTTLPLPISTELILQLGHTQKRILSSSKALQLLSKYCNPQVLIQPILPATVNRRAENLQVSELNEKKTRWAQRSSGRVSRLMRLSRMSVMCRLTRQLYVQLQDTQQWHKVHIMPPYHPGQQHSSAKHDTNTALSDAKKTSVIHMHHPYLSALRSWCMPPPFPCLSSLCHRPLTVFSS